MPSPLTNFFKTIGVFHLLKTEIQAFLRKAFLKVTLFLVLFPPRGITVIKYARARPGGALTSNCEVNSTIHVDSLPE